MYGAQSSFSPYQMKNIKRTDGVKNKLLKQDQRQIIDEILVHSLPSLHCLLRGALVICSFGQFFVRPIDLFHACALVFYKWRSGVQPPAYYKWRRIRR